MKLASVPAARHVADSTFSDPLADLYPTSPRSLNTTDSSWTASNTARAARRTHHASTVSSPSPSSAARVISPPPPHGLRSGALSPASQHGRLHKRANSASSVPGPRSPPQSVDGAGVQPFLRTDPPPITYEEEQWTYPASPAAQAPPAPPPPPPPGSKIKPYLRKLSHKDSNTLDLSRPAAENESLAGLGINDYGDESRSASDVTFSHVGRRTRHNRSISNTSQFSTGSGSQRPTAAYMHPMRQTPRPYTPPVSYPTSVVGSDVSDAGADSRFEEETRYRQQLVESSLQSRSMSSTPSMASPLQIQTTNLPTILTNHSQTSFSTAATGNRPRRDTIKSIDTTSPSSRTSLDKAFHFIRGRDSPVDPASRAASIRAARQAYREKEEAKARKADMESLKRQDKQEKRQRSKQEAATPPQQPAPKGAGTRPARSRTGSGTLLNEKADGGAVQGLDYASFSPAHTRSLPRTGPPGGLGPVPPERAATGLSTVKTAKSRWLGFVTWLRTRLLKLGRKLHLAS